MLTIDDLNIDKVTESFIDEQTAIEIQELSEELGDELAEIELDETRNDDFSENLEIAILEQDLKDLL